MIRDDKLIGCSSDETAREYPAKAASSNENSNRDGDFRHVVLSSTRAEASARLTRCGTSHELLRCRVMRSWEVTKV